MNQNRTAILEQIQAKATVSDPVTLDDKLLHIGIDSLAKIDLVIMLEECFGIQFAESDLDPTELNTVEDIILLAEKYLQKGADAK